MTPRPSAALMSGNVGNLARVTRDYPSFTIPERLTRPPDRMG